MANPNPSPSTRIGQPGGPAPGKSSEHRKAEIRAAEKAALVQADLVDALYNTVQAAGDDEERLAAIRSDVLKLLKDSQDRGFGAPQVHVDNTSSDGSMTPSAQTGDAVLDALTRKHSPESGTEGA